jgi:hypothetical protein
MMHPQAMRGVQRIAQLVKRDVGVLRDQLDQKALVGASLPRPRLPVPRLASKGSPRAIRRFSRDAVAAEIRNRRAASRPLRPSVT